MKKFLFILLLGFLSFPGPVLSDSLVVTAPGAGTWSVPLGVHSGDLVAVETWGAGSGGTGRVASTFGAAGAGGAFASSTYALTPNDIANGVPYTVGVGTTGLSGANPVAGGDSSFSTNNINLIPDTGYDVAAVGTPGTLPNNWFVTGGTGLTQQVVGFGVSAEGFPFTSVRFSGTTGSTSTAILIVGNHVPAYGTGKAAITGGNTYTQSMYLALVGGSLTNISSVTMAADTSDVANAFVGTPISLPVSLTGILTRATSSAAISATGTPVWASPYIIVAYSNGVAVDFTIEIAAPQFELAGAATFFKSTPGYTIAKGGGAPSGTIGGVGSITGSVGAVTIKGGSGADFNAAGSGAGGGGGKDGAGLDGNTSGQGGRGDTTGGLGGAVKAGTPGNPGIDNVEGGGGGGGITAAGTAGVGGAPAGGGGGAVVATGTGGAGANGQIRLTWTPRIGSVKSNLLLLRTGR